MIELRDPILLVILAMGLATVLLIIKMLSVLRAPRGDVPDVRDKAKTSGKYEFYICIIGVSHQWVRTRNDDMNFNHDGGRPRIGGDVLEVRVKDLYEIEAGKMTRIRWRLRGIKSGFVAVFDDNGKPVGYIPPKKSAYLLKTVEESRALTKAMKDEFKQAIEGKAIFMYVILIVVAIVAYLVLTGQLRVDL